MPPDELKWLADALDAARQIREYSADKTREDFGSSRGLRDQIYMNFIVIGESISRLRSTNAAMAESITEWSRIVGFRNQIAHGYFALNHDITWNIIEEK